MDDRIESSHWVGTDSVSAIPLSTDIKIGATQSVDALCACNDISLSPSYVLSKRVVDILGTIVLVIVFSPVLLIVTLSLSLNGGTVLFRHSRIGRDGKAFKVYKFRSMVPNAGQVLGQLVATDPILREEWLRDHKLKDDPRVTRVGKFLRKTSLDELPQLWNVLKGEMSLVGPRPVIREELSKYGRAARYYLAVKPGLTGIWQVSGRNDTDYRRRVAMDRYYACTASLGTDLVVLAKTVDVVLRRRGAY
jgi:Undecaprenyl-phosphate galactose phosphotransferase WbaP